MIKKNRVAGRFLPSRVYARWKWTVRFGLCVVPFILMLAGGLTLYFKPSRYASSASFEYLGKRPLSEVEALLKSRNILEDTARDNELATVLGVDIDTAIDVLLASLETRLDPGSGMFEVTVTHPLKEIARDLAASLPTSLERYENKLVSQNTHARLQVAEKSLHALEEETDDKQQMLSRVIATRGDQTTDAMGRLDVDAARRDWEFTFQQLLARRANVAELNNELGNPVKWVTIHSRPEISRNAVNRQGDELFGFVFLQALGAGLLVALLVPYVQELAFPRLRPNRRKKIRGDEEVNSLDFPMRHWRAARE